MLRKSSWPFVPRDSPPVPAEELPAFALVRVNPNPTFGREGPAFLGTNIPPVFGGGTDESWRPSLLNCKV
jgi:hypothetical protein